MPRLPAALRCFALAFVLATGTSASARAQSAPVADTPRGTPATAPKLDEAERMTALRLTQLNERRREGLWLLGWGALNTLAGSVLAGVSHGDQALLAGSVTTLGFGAVNALLSLGLLDLSHARRRAILQDQPTNAEAREALRARAQETQLKSGQAFALNTGLDVAYLVAGALLYALGRQDTRSSGWEVGAGLAMLGQGAFLLGFDVVCWLRSNRRAARWRVFH